MIHIVSASRYKIGKRSLQKQVSEIMAKYRISPDTIINIVFVGKRKMTEIATTYKNESVALPVLSFTYNQETEANEKLLGEIVICYPQAILLAAERGKKVDVMLLQLIDHGIQNLLK